MLFLSYINLALDKIWDSRRTCMSVHEILVLNAYVSLPCLVRAAHKDKDVDKTSGQLPLVLACLKNYFAHNNVISTKISDKLAYE